MDMKTYLKQASPEQRAALADKVTSSVGYFYLIGGGHRKPSVKLCQRLVAAEPMLSLTELRPDVWSSGGVQVSESATANDDAESVPAMPRRRASDNEEASHE